MLFTACTEGGVIDEGGTTEQPGGGNTEEPENPENPEDPENPENPEDPEDPENPENPENPADKTRAIEFQDENTKLICTLHWDEDEDGELSYEEAAAVTSIGTIFNGSQILAFTELKYFTSLRKIEDSAFEGCNSLVKITLPEQITTIGEDAFSECANLTKIVIPDSVTLIDCNAFYECKRLTSATIGNGVTEIGWYAFQDCTSLVSVTIGNSVTLIGHAAFSYCSSLTNVIIPNSVNTIEDEAFIECTSLKSITIPDSVTSIEQQAFDGCTSLKEVYCKATTPPAGGKFMFNGIEQQKIYVPKESVNAYKSAEYWKVYASRIVGYDFDKNTIDTDVEITVAVDSVVGITGNPEHEASYPSDSTMCIYIEANGYEIKSIMACYAAGVPAELTPEEALAHSGADISSFIPDLIEYGYALLVVPDLTPGTTYDIFLGFTTIYGETKYFHKHHTTAAAE